MSKTVLTFDALLKAATDAGSKAADGVDSILALGYIAYSGKRASIVDDKNVRELYVAYATAANGSKYGSKIDLSKVDAVDVAVSKLRVFTKLADVPGKPWNVVDQTVKYLDGADDGKKLGGSRYEKAIQVARKAISQKAASFTQAEIKGFLTPAIKKPDAVKELEGIMARAKTAMELPEFVGQSLHFQRVMNACQEGIDQIKAEAVAKAEAEPETTVEDLDAAVANLAAAA